MGSNDKLADLYGTTLKSNDIKFRIFSPIAQKEVDAAMPPQLKGLWGALCSHVATEEQLEKTGATANDPHWRPVEYAVSETGLPGLSGDARSKEYEAASLAKLSHGGTCALAQSPDAAAATKTRTASVGHYVGNSTLENTVNVNYCPRQQTAPLLVGITDVRVVPTMRCERGCDRKFWGSSSSTVADQHRLEDHPRL